MLSSIVRCMRKIVLNLETEKKKQTNKHFYEILMENDTLVLMVYTQFGNLTCPTGQHGLECYHNYGNLLVWNRKRYLIEI